MQKEPLIEKTDEKFRLRELLLTKWSPNPIEPPKVNPEIESLDPLKRSAESLRYSILTFEYWVSASGRLREWVRHNSRLALVLGIPVFLILPIITFALSQFLAWLVMMVAIAGKLIVFPFLALLAALVTAVIFLLLRGIFGK